MKQTFKEYLFEAIAVSIEELEKAETPEEKAKKKKKRVGWTHSPDGILKYIVTNNSAQG